MTDSKKVEEILRQAADAVAAADLPKEVQSVAFGKAVDLIAGVPAEIQPRHGAKGKSQNREADDPDDPLQKIATRLGVDRELLDETLEVEDGAVSLTIARSKLASQKTKGTKQIAVLVAAARQAAGIEEWTETKTIRVVADDYGKYDSPNFAASLSELGDFFSFSGSGQGRKLKMRRAGFDEAAALIKRLQVGKS